MDRRQLVIRVGIGLAGLLLIVVAVRLFLQGRLWQGVGLLWAGLAVWSIPLGWLPRT